ncbi:MAG TPA: hypothetical protein VHW02_11610 [Rhizomicrobium sp.]|jgi:hypothetical protein|nr:hypothetical protein [Rhizomicrobium sp.]
MWDFSLSRSFAMMIQTLPFIILRLLVYIGIGIAYILAVGVGAVVGYGIGHFWSDTGAHAAGGFWGGLFGFGIVSAVLYLAREYLLYLVKAAHIAVLVQVLDGKPIPGGQNQVSYGADFVKTHFAESSILFGVDQIIKGVLRIITGTLAAFTAFLPVPALQTLVNIANSIIRMSLTYVDEIILAYLIRTQTTNPWDSAKDGLILYAQNYKHFLKNAVWLSIFMWVVTIAIFILLLGPATAIAYKFPGSAALWAFGFAIIFAIALKKSLLEPLAIASLMQVYFKTIEGQTPDPQWEERLTTASAKFRELAQKAAGWIPKAAGASTPLPPSPKPAA